MGCWGTVSRGILLRACVACAAALSALAPAPAPAATTRAMRDPIRSTLDGVSQIAPGTVGSSDPTYYASNHRLALTKRGRLLALHGRHAEGVQLAWRDAGAEWRTDSRGGVDDGLLRADSGTGDWPASIALATDSAGRQKAWVVWAAPSIGALAPRTVVEMRRISQLDAHGGPRIGPLVTLVSAEHPTPTLGVARVDLAFEPAPDGSSRGVLTWQSKTEPTTTVQMTGWITDLDSNRPELVGVHPLFTASSARAATLESDGSGTRLVIRNPTGELALFHHSPGAGLDAWEEHSPGLALSASAGHPAATLLPNGHTVVAIEAEDDVVTIQRWRPNGSVRTVRTLAGYREPTLTTKGRNVFMVAVRAEGGDVVSRKVAGKHAGAAQDTIEIPASVAPDAADPNALRRTEGRLHFIVRGERSGTSRSSVLAFQRAL